MVNWQMAVGQVTSAMVSEMTHIELMQLSGREPCHPISGTIFYNEGLSPRELTTWCEDPSTYKPQEKLQKRYKTAMDESKLEAKPQQNRHYNSTASFTPAGWT